MQEREARRRNYYDSGTAWIAGRWIRRTGLYAWESRGFGEQATQFLIFVK